MVDQAGNHGAPSRVALVMAGTRGLGLACARELAASGHAVAVCGRDEAALAAATDELRASGPALAVVADVSKEEDVRRMVAETRAALGPVTVLIASAGGPPQGGFEELSGDDWDTAYRLNLKSVVIAVQETVPDMRRQGEGRIVVIGSSSIKRPNPGLTLSNTFRPALNGLVKDLAVSLAPDRITVNLVAPGRVATDRTRALDERRAAARGVPVEQVAAESARSIPMGRYGRPEEFAALVGFLASREASYITGQSVLADGGKVAGL